jgi:DNA-binding NtrC family response regulator
LFRKKDNDYYSNDYDNEDNNHKDYYNKNIMVLDDESDLATIVKEILQRNGFKNVFAFTNPLLAMEHFKINHKDYSLVISDIRMPSMNGFEFVQNITRVKPDIKVLLMTVFDINNDDDDLLNMNQNYNSNVSGIIKKPVSTKQLAKIPSETAMP